MIMQNPIFKRESTVNARSFKFALMLLVFNGILAVVALLNMYSTLSQISVTAEVQYTSFLDLYTFVAILEFVMLLFLTPALTTGSISGEKERKTLELMLTTNVSPTQIVIGKMMSALSTILLMVISSLPIFAMVFVYGGVTARDISALLICYVATAIYAGSIGICCSAIFKKTTISTVVAYGIMGILLLGTYGMNQFIVHTANAVGGNFLIQILFMNPATTFFVTIVQLIGPNQGSGIMPEWLGIENMNGFIESWITISIIIQLIVSVGFISIASYAISPKRKRFGKKPE